MDDDLHAKIAAMVDEEHALRKAHAPGSGPDETELHRLRALEEQLDRTWDLLRQRHARRDAGQDVGAAKDRGSDVVEGYVG
jgi:chromosome condensin MukBEF complex kleisin-like MukF subunit